MAKDGVKKGFFFYLGLFLLIILGILSVLMIVMMFMPKTNILGIQYFTNSSAIRVDTTTNDSKIPIDFNYGSNFNKVEITTNFANVSIQKNSEFDRNGIYFVNKSRGFVTTKNANEFSYYVTIEDGVLKITLEEENAFLYFSKEIEVVFQISNESVNPLANKPIAIVTNSGNVCIGGTYAAGESHIVSLNDLNVETKTGDITISTYSTDNYNSLSLKTRSGDINVRHPNISAKQISIETESGDISATKFASSQNVSLTSKKGKISISEIDGNVDFKVVDTYVKIGTIRGSADFSNSVGEFKSAVVNIGLVGENLTATEAADTDFNIGAVHGRARIETMSGNISIDEKVFSNWILKTATGSITANLNADVTEVDISTEKGKLNLIFPNAFSNVTVSNKEGKTYLTLQKQGRYAITFKYYDSGNDFDLSTFDFKNINLNLDVEKSNPIIIENSGTAMSYLTLKCSGVVNFTWEESA